MLRFRCIAFSLVLLALLVTGVRSAESLPPAPHDYFNDYAQLVPAGTGKILNQLLADFERESSNQIVVAIFPRMESASSIEDYTVRIAQSWRVGSRQHDNGAVLFIFVEERKVYIQVGYGLEARLTDARCRQIIANEITPRFAAGHYDEGVQFGLYAMLDAVRGEYQGNGKTTVGRVTTEKDEGQTDNLGVLFVIIGSLVFFVVACISYARRSAATEEFSATGHRSSRDDSGAPEGFRTVLGVLRGALMVASLFSRSSGSSSSRGGSSGSSFSGGGGRFGGGGAGGSW